MHAKSYIRFGSYPWYNSSALIFSLSAFKPSSVVSRTSSSVKVLTFGCAPLMIPDRKLSSLLHFFPSTTISLKFRSPVTLCFFAFACSFANSYSTSALRLAVSLSASRPAIRELVLVGRGSSLRGGCPLPGRGGCLRFWGRLGDDFLRRG